ncbi:hypothetical protein D3C86_720670 [compost metagenome]
MSTALRARAKASRAARRGGDIATPVGNWCEGVTQTTRASGGMRSTHRPSSSVGTVTTFAPAASMASRSEG